MLYLQGQKRKNIGSKLRRTGQRANPGGGGGVEEVAEEVAEEVVEVVMGTKVTGSASRGPERGTGQLPSNQNRKRMQRRGVVKRRSLKQSPRQTWKLLKSNNY